MTVSPLARPDLGTVLYEVMGLVSVYVSLPLAFLLPSVLVVVRVERTTRRVWNLRGYGRIRLIGVAWAIYRPVVVQSVIAARLLPVVVVAIALDYAGANERAWAGERRLRLCAGNKNCSEGGESYT